MYLIAQSVIFFQWINKIGKSIFAEKCIWSMIRDMREYMGEIILPLAI
jgi:hypothetical protein